MADKRTGIERIADEQHKDDYDCNCPQGSCRADSDGDCDWLGCPQLRDGEPEKTGRDCPLLDEHHPKCDAIANGTGKRAPDAKGG